MDLDDELRRMFANSGDQLDIPVRGDAEQTIVAGAGRRRKRRLAAMSASGAAAVVVVVVVGIALANPTPEAMPPAHVPTSTSSTPTPPSSELAPTTPTGTGSAVPPAAPPATGGGDPPGTSENTEEPPPEPEVTGELIGPSGWRELRLGMSFEDAVATGLIVETGTPPGPGCNGYTIATSDGSHGGQVNISAESGVEFISPYGKVHTPEGVSEGWTIEQFLELYPEMADEVAQGGSVSIPVAGNSAAEYRIDHFGTGMVETISLQLSSQICYS